MNFFRPVLRLCSALLPCLLFSCGDTASSGPWEARTEAAVRGALAADAPALRAETLRLLGLTGDPRWTPRLREGLLDPSPLVQAAALGILLERGDEHAERRAAELLLRDEPAERAALLGLAVEHSGETAARQLLDRALRDSSPDVALRAIDVAQEQGLPLRRASLLPLRDAADPRLASAAFDVLHRSDPEESLTWIIGELRSGDGSRAQSALARVATTRIPDLWPTLRSATAHDPQLRAAALPALGMLGDRQVTEDLRSLLFTQDEIAAAQALYALSHIDEDRARNQPARLASDRRSHLRRTGLEAIIARHLPTEDLSLFLHDTDERIAARALAELLAREDSDATRVLREQLGVREVRVGILQGMYRYALLSSSWSHVEEVSDLLRPLLRSERAAERDLARRLLLGMGVPRDQLLRAEGDETLDDYARYLIAELALREGTAVSDVEAWLGSDLLLVRIAGLLLLSGGHVEEAEPTP